MKFLFDVFPVLLFFSIFKWSTNNLAITENIITQYLSFFMLHAALKNSQAPVLLATTAVIFTTLIQTSYILIRYKKIDSVYLASVITIIICGSATIYFNNDNFIKWKPTVLYWWFCITLCISQFIFKKNLIYETMKEKISLPKFIWHDLNVAWSVFFLALGCVNLYIAFNYTTNAWVVFKVFGVTTLTSIFILVQGLYLFKYIKNTCSNES